MAKTLASGASVLRQSLLDLLLCRFLMQRSYGIPYYCEELLSYLRQHDLLLFQQQRKQEKAEAKWENLFSKHLCGWLPRCCGASPTALSCPGVAPRLWHGRVLQQRRARSGSGVGSRAAGRWDGRSRGWGFCWL